MTTRLTITIVLALTAAPAFAGDCRYGSFAGRSVVSCDNGYVEVHGRHGSRSYGIRNGGFDRYPSHTPPPWAMERREPR